MATWRGGHSGGGGMYGGEAQRNALFGNNHGGGYSPVGQNGQQAQSVWEEQNNAATARLGAQIDQLKQVTIAINTEVNEQNDQLSGFIDKMGRTGQLMAGTLNKLGVMLETGGGRHMCFLVMSVVGIFLFMYLFLLRK